MLPVHLIGEPDSRPVVFFMWVIIGFFFFGLVTANIGAIVIYNTVINIIQIRDFFQCVGFSRVRNLICMYASSTVLRTGVGGEGRLLSTAAGLANSTHMIILANLRVVCDTTVEDC